MDIFSTNVLAKVVERLNTTQKKVLNGSLLRFWAVWDY